MGELVHSAISGLFKQPVTQQERFSSSHYVFSGGAAFISASRHLWLYRGRWNTPASSGTDDALARLPSPLFKNSKCRDTYLLFQPVVEMIFRFSAYGGY
jgi:hypothetical protein